MDESLAPKPILYTPWVDLMRVVAIYLVVIAHVSGQLTNAWGQIPTMQWMIANAYGGIARISVPLFFMLSGYLLLPRSESLHEFYSRRMLKILIPFVVWSLIYLSYYCISLGHTCTSNVIADLLLVKGAYYHLWFLYPLISIYFILPLLRLMIQPETNKKLLWYLILLWLIFQPAITLANHFWDFRINISAPLATSTTIIGTYFLSHNADQFDPFFYDFLTLNVIFASAAAFILLKWLAQAKEFTSPQANTITRQLAARAFGIYLIHILVMEALSFWIPMFHINSFIGNAIWSIPLVGTLVFLLSLIIVAVLQKIPIIQQIVP